jgi:predicted PurR-regulated permease PerM
MDEDFIKEATATAIRLAFLIILCIWCYKIISPFIIPVLWGIIMAVAIYPVYKKLAAVIGNREKLAAVLLTLLILSLLIVPTLLFIDTTEEGVKSLWNKIEAGNLSIPPPPEQVATWPIIGKPIDEIWRLGSENISAVVKQFEPQIKKYGAKALSTAASLGVTLLQFMISIIIAGALLAYAKSSEQTAHTVFVSLLGEQQKDFAKLTAATIRSVFYGVMGVAFIQSTLAGIGMLIVGVPGAGLLSLIVLIMAIVQLPAIILLLPVIIYVFTITTTTSAVVFAIWTVMVSFSDNFLKPLLLGRGVEAPMLVILLGAIGGMISTGLIGLFLGAVILTLGYTVFSALLDTGASEPQNVKDSANNH